MGAAREVGLQVLFGLECSCIGAEIGLEGVEGALVLDGCAPAIAAVVNSQSLLQSTRKTSSANTALFFGCQAIRNYPPVAVSYLIALQGGITLGNNRVVSLNGARGGGVTMALSPVLDAAPDRRL